MASGIRLRAVKDELTAAEGRLRELTSKTKGLISLFGGEPEFPTPKHIVEAAKRALDEGETHYASFRGLPELKEAIADYYKRYDVDVEPEAVFPSVGSTLGLYVAIQTLVGPGDAVIVSNPCYVAYPWLVRNAGGTVSTFPLYEEKGYGLDPRDIEKLVTPGTRGLIICNPDNPTGAVYSRDDLEAIADISVKNDLWVITDDTYDRIMYDGLRFHSIAAMPGMRERTFIINSLSKTYAMTGWRLGYIIVPEEAVQAFADHMARAFLTVNTAVQMAGVAALRGPQDCVDEMVREYDRKRRFTVETLNSIEGVSCVMPKGAFYAFPNISALGLPSVRLAEFLVEEARVVFRPGVAFGSEGEGHLRLSFAERLETVREALIRFEAGVKKLKKR